MMAAAKVVAIAAFLRPNATVALCSVRSRGISALPFRRRIASYGLSNCHLLMVTPSIHRQSFSIKATTDSDSPAASFESPLMESMEKKIKEHLSAESVIVKDAYGDGRHVSIEVVSSAFEGQSAVSRQRMVYKAIWEELQDRVHAVDHMTTRTPAEVKH